MRTDYIKEQLNKAGVAANNAECAKLDRYLEMIVETNKVFNLTAITEFEDMVEKHLVDSLLLLSSENVSRETFSGDTAAFYKLISASIKKDNSADPIRETDPYEEGNVSRETFLPNDHNVSRETFSQNKVRWIDIGTGAGLPGIPLKVMCPETEFTLLDSLNKRVNFLGEVINSLELSDIAAIHARAEDLARDPDHRDSYDICVSRAVANLSTLLELCLPFVRKGGYFAAYKSDNVSDELKTAKNAIKKLNGAVSEVRHINLPGSEAGRTLVIIRKTAETSPFYPRKAGQPSKKPL